MFNPESFIAEQIDEIRARVKDGKAIIACSGGVDSTVAAMIASKALGENLLAVFVDTGYIRKNEAKTVSDLLTALKINFRLIDASGRFYKNLEKVTEPEQKRKIIGETFIRIFEEQAKEFGATWLVQGTIAPDWIESGGQRRDVIKSHHNVGGLPKDMNIGLIEPLRDLYKDEVRVVGRHQKIPIAEKQPFPGPGLAIRVIGEATKERAAIVREACAIVEEELELATQDKKMTIPWQYFAVLIPLKSVGVHGDRRAYGYTIVVRAVESLDAMSAEYSKIPHEVLEKISIRISNSMKESVTRVVFDITNKPPATIEWE